MSVKISELAEELRSDTEWQKTPRMLTDSDYERLIIKGIRTLYRDTNRASIYNKETMYSEDENGRLLFIEDLPLDEQEYVLLCAKIAFFKLVQADVNNIVGYTTNALTVTNSDKPYANLKDTISDLDNERRIAYYKMTRFTIG